MAVKVIGAGFSRTGTLSLKAALEQLGFDPCYHMAEVVLPRPGANDGHLEAWCDYYLRGRPIDWIPLLAGYQATLDSPTCYHYREQMDAFPDAKVVLTVRDPDDWFDSWQAVLEAIEAARAPGRMIRYQAWPPMMDALVARHFDGVVERRANIDVYLRHNEEVRRHVPADRLLELRITEGWKPLCDFLGVAVPESPFPCRNARKDLQDLLDTVLCTELPVQL